MCSINPSQESQDDLDKDKIRKEVVANKTGNIMKTYGDFGKNAIKTPVSILEIKNNVDKRNARLEALMRGEDDPYGY